MEPVLARLRELPGGSELLELAARRDDVEWSAARCATCCSARCPRELDVVVAADGRRLARSARVDALRDRRGLRRATATSASAPPLVELGRRGANRRRATGAPSRYPGAGSAAGGARGHARGGSASGATSPSTRSPSRWAARARASCDAVARRAGGSARAGDCAYCTTQLHRRPHAPAAPGPLRARGWSSRSSPTPPSWPRAHWPRARWTRSRARASAPSCGSRWANRTRSERSRRWTSLGLLAALHPRLRFDRRGARPARSLLLGEDGRPDLLILAALMLPLALRAGDDPRAEIVALLDRLEFRAADRDRIAAAATAVRAGRELLVARTPVAAARSRLQATPPEGIALAGALGRRDQWRGVTVSPGGGLPLVRRCLCHMRLQITGEDLLAAGIPEGPEIGRRLEAALRMQDSTASWGRVVRLSCAAALESNV